MQLYRLDETGKWVWTEKQPSLREAILQIEDVHCLHCLYDIAVIDRLELLALAMQEKLIEKGEEELVRRTLDLALLYCGLKESDPFYKELKRGLKDTTGGQNVL